MLRAASSLAEWARERGIAHDGAALFLEKNLPVASGIGGGSADAAATLRGLAQLWSLQVEKAALAEMAGRLGADVPACLEGSAAMMEGIGERITPVPELPPTALLLVNPRIALATPSVYRQFREEDVIAPAPRAKPIGPFADSKALIAALAETRNDLERVALRLCPDIGEVLSALKDSGADLARMSGSGATCFALFADPAAAAVAHASIGGSKRDWWVARSVLQ